MRSKALFFVKINVEKSVFENKVTDMLSAILTCYSIKTKKELKN